MISLTIGSTAAAPAASIIGSVTGTTLTVSGVTSGSLAVGQILNGTAVSGAGLYVTGLLSGTGGVGTYQVSSGYSFANQALTAIGMSGTQVQMTAGQMPVTASNYVNLILQ